MSGDYSKDSFDALRDYAGVFLQQGRAVLDADWNEMVEIFERRIRAGTVDTIGRAVVPRETETGFEIQITGANDIEIGPGRFYASGMLAECHGLADFTGATPDRPAPVFDRGTNVEEGGAGVLDEMIAPPDGAFLPYDQQPYWPTPDDLPGETGAHLAYLVVWQRELTPVKDPSLLEPALGGIDTATRWQTVWQVRMLENVGDNATCATDDEDLDNWIETKAPSTARLTSATIQIDDPENPCLVPPTDGYTGIENQFYRVELHATAEGEAPTGFKFSRENASVAASIDSISNPANSITVTRIGRDDILRFEAGDWVEVTDNHREFNHRSGQMLRIETVNPETREIAFAPGSVIAPDLIPGGGDGDTLADRRTRLIRWDQSGIIRLADNSEWTNLNDNTSDGLIPIPPEGTAVILENGITVTFSTAVGPGQYRDMDYWRFAARTAGTQIDELREAPPEGIQRHYNRLAIVRFPASVLDCRIFWPPEFEGGDTESCGCTVCVSAESHNSGALTIQAAIDQVGAQGGTVCLDAGNYNLDQPVTIAGRTGIKVTGQGIGTILLYQGAGGAFRIEGSIDVQLERFSLFAAPSEDANGASTITHGIAAENTALLALRRLAVIAISATPSDSFNFGIALDGLQLGTKIEECLVLAPHAIGSRSSYGLDEDGDLTFVGFVELRVLDCILFGGRVAVLFDEVALNIAQAHFSRNLVFGQQSGMRLSFAEIPAASTQITASTIIANRDAMRLGSNDLRVLDCEISGGTEVGDGIRLLSSLIPEARTDAQIIGNSISELAGDGIHIEGSHAAILIKRNMIRRCGSSGIRVEPSADIQHLAIDNNVFEDIADTTGLESGAAIYLTSTTSGQIIGNGIQAVGRGGVDGGSYSGIAVQGVGAVSIESNALSEIGPDLPEAEAIAIRIRQPYDDIILNANRINGSTLTGDNNFTGWTAISIGSPAPRTVSRVPLGQISNGFRPDLGTGEVDSFAYLIFDEQLYRVGPQSFRAATTLGRANQIGVASNHIRNATRVGRPMVQIFDAGTVSLNFSQNQCVLSSGGGLNEVIHLGAQRMSVSGNSILHQTDALSLRMTTGPNRAATPVGNITTAGIQLNSSDLNAPFDALNITA